MIGRKIPLFLAIIMLLAAPASARFEQGTFHFGAGMGLRGSEGGAVFSLGVSGGFFVLKGLDLGISTVLHTGGDIPTQCMTTGSVRFIPLPDLVFTPYIKAGGGRLFIEGDDAWTVSVGGGFLYMMGPWYGIDLQGTYFWLFFPGEDPYSDYTITAGLVLFF